MTLAGTRSPCAPAFYNWDLSQTPLLVLYDVSLVDHDSLPLCLVQPVLPSPIVRIRRHARVVRREHHAAAEHGGQALGFVVDGDLVEGAVVVHAAGERVCLHVGDDFGLPLGVRERGEMYRVEKG